MLLDVKVCRTAFTVYAWMLKGFSEFVQFLNGRLLIWLSV